METLDLAPVNLRDLGGLPVAGGTVRPGVLLRSDDVSVMPAAFAQQMIDDGVTSVIDLRSPEEALMTGRGPLTVPGVNYHHLALTASVSSPEDISHEIMSSATTPAQVGAWYANLLETQARQLALGVTLVAMSEGTTVFHCAAGKDRTGVFAAVVLSALGATPATISADYAVTATRLPQLFPRLRAIMGGLMPDRVLDEEAIKGMGAMMGAHAESMETMQRLLVERHGSVLEPVRHAGLSDATIAELRERLVAEDA
ncbi:tyrosine-protein phosphatase [Paenarthrobacter nitroguajacolicus]|uniref:tyrosine-protein phosphatase n=1 Tax=Paenarthrobacter nitroguajacolicus TaxID=211146 RepID=UPI0015BF0718|nr:tyrosine-protein phosphatase [Paenarthrobacter nitroguajacolicus]NWL35147.1 protein-tyrosine-phosphatase [Paenarthrobacter nitroguajacolicus]